ncbi:MAG: hypothetical protein R2845_07210 [Thermomicrobiales bacterium]
MEHPVPEVACCSVTPLAVRELVPDGDWSAFLDYLDEFNALPPDEAFAKMFGSRAFQTLYAHFASMPANVHVGRFPRSAQASLVSGRLGADVRVTARSLVERGGQAS